MAVATAKYGHLPGAAHLIEVNLASFRPDARVAIEAMRDPTLEMELAADDRLSAGHFESVPVSIVWDAMIDEALKMSEKIWQPGELEDYLCALHARLQAATGSTAAPINLSVAEITVLLQVIECFVSDD
jgi:hypothetical protein